MSRWKRREDVHPGRDCVSCSACGTDGGSFRHPNNWNEEFKEWIMTSSQLDMQSCLCLKCSRSLRRKWENFRKDDNKENSDPAPKKSKSDSVCVVGLLEHDPSLVRSLCSENVIRASFKGCNVESVAACFKASSSEVASACTASQSFLGDCVVTLCKLHHSQLYRWVFMHTALFTLCSLVIAFCRFIHFSKVECTTCGMGIQKIARHCPDPALISAYLRETCQVVKDVTETSPVCSRCYFSHLRIAKVKSNSDMMSTDDGTKQLRKELSGKEESLVGDDTDIIVGKALLQTGVWVTEMSQSSFNSKDLERSTPTNVKSLDRIETRKW
ncbi:uncharacterized protein LOC134190399 [Corticium candelabrum]|uniref:uncharacterized protein LOC134190399 n=1 Tax=Corticium candelabrum TaxID=121492 RepID=UPI002E256886|nr:uncharacterized protein LOC134190399 [Corticium candelabrum]